MNKRIKDNLNLLRDIVKNINYNLSWLRFYNKREDYNGIFNEMERLMLNLARFIEGVKDLGNNLLKEVNYDKEKLNIQN